MSINLRVTLKRKVSSMTYKTSQKEKLLTYMIENSQAQLPMQTILNAMKQEGVGESTVYRLMKSLVDEGKVRRFVCGNNRRFFYQALKDEKCGHHIHLKCLSCGKMVHLSGFVSDFIEKNILAANRFTIDGQMTLLYGKCENCQENC